MQREVKDGLEKNFLMNPLELYDLIEIRGTRRN